MARLTERVVDLFMDIFTDEDFNDRIAAMNAHYDEEPDLLKPILVVLDDPPTVVTPRNFPAIHVWGTGMNNGVDQPLSLFGANHTIRIAVAVQGTERLMRQVYRYADVILQVVDEVTKSSNQSFSLGGDIDVEYGEPPYESTGAKVIQAVLTVQMEHAESLALEVGP